MSKTLTMGLAVLIAVTGIGPAAADPCTDPVNIPDPLLLTALQIALHPDPVNCSTLARAQNLDLSQGRITNIEGVQYATNAYSINLHSNYIEDLSPLSGAYFPNLTGLQISRNRIRDLGPIAGIANLQSLVAYENPIADVSALTAFPNLTNLDLNRTLIDTSDLYGLRSLPLLTLRISNTGVTSVAPLSAIQTLRVVEMAETWVSDLTPLASLPHLVHITAYATPLMGLPDFSATDLTFLHVGDCRLSNVAALASAPGLRQLYLYGNSASNLGALQQLTNLELLMLHDNKIRDIQYLVDNSGLGSGDSVSLYGNCLDLSPGGVDATAVQALRDRGVSVSDGPQQTDCRPPKVIIGGLPIIRQ